MQKTTTNSMLRVLSVPDFRLPWLVLQLTGDPLR